MRLDEVIASQSSDVVTLMTSINPTFQRKVVRKRNNNLSTILSTLQSKMAERMPPLLCVSTYLAVYGDHSFAPDV